jgi:microcystin-dependent protein
MSEPFVAQVQIFPYNFAPLGWALCQGQILAISQNTALFSLIGTFYGGDGKSNFALPDLRSRSAIGAGTAPGLTPRVVGEEAGEETVTLLPNQIPAHTHPANCNSGVGTDYGPSGDVWAADAGGNNEYGSKPIAGQMSPNAVLPVGGGQPHNNLQPYVGMNYCIALQGVFPARS